MIAPPGEPEAIVWVVTATDGAHTLVLHVLDAPSALIARSLTILQLWQHADAGLAIDLSNLEITAVARVPHVG